MSDLMATTVEVWPVAADEAGLWLLNPTGPWPSLPITKNAGPQMTAELELIQHQVTLGTGVLHSTSWRSEWLEESSQYMGVWSYLAVVPCAGLVRDEWPDALPITPRLADHLGPAPTHAPTEAPDVRHWDVLLHGLRHLRFLMETDATITAELLLLGWRPHLARFEPAIARMYSQVHGAA